eukprot:4458673-Prymnesium_polylepis.1
MSSAKRAAPEAEDPSPSKKQAADEAPWSGPADSLEHTRRSLRVFAKAREWDQFHLPRNLALALVGEVGELCEIFQWKGEVAPGLPGWSEKDRVHLGEEMSDVFMCVAASPSWSNTPPIHQNLPSA